MISGSLVSDRLKQARYIWLYLKCSNEIRGVSYLLLISTGYPCRDTKNHLNGALKRIVLAPFSIISDNG